MLSLGLCSNPHLEEIMTRYRYRALTKQWTIALGCAALLTTLAVFPQAGVAKDFYKGKTIRLLLGAAPGGGYDTYGRAMVRHMNKHIPGNPSFVVQNMPGAGSAKAADYLYNVLKKDGLTIGGIFPGAIVGKLLDDRSTARFDPVKFIYLGSAASDNRLCVTFHTSKVKTLKDAQTNVVPLGASARGGSTRDYAYMLNNLIGTKFKVVSGYKGSKRIVLAIERGEADGICGYSYSSLLSGTDWVQSKKANLLVQVALKPTPALTKMGVPFALDLVKGDNRKVMELIVAQQVFGRPYVLAPGTPADRVKILRAAFDATMKDKGFLADSKKRRIIVNPVSGTEVEALVKKMYAADPKIIARAKTVVLEPKK